MSNFPSRVEAKAFATGELSTADNTPLIIVIGFWPDSDVGLVARHPLSNQEKAEIRHLPRGPGRFIQYRLRLAPRELISIGPLVLLAQAEIGHCRNLE